MKRRRHRALSNRSALVVTIFLMMSYLIIFYYTISNENQTIHIQKALESHKIKEEEIVVLHSDPKFYQEKVNPFKITSPNQFKSIIRAVDRDYLSITHFKRSGVFNNPPQEGSKAQSMQEKMYKATYKNIEEDTKKSSNGIEIQLEQSINNSNEKMNLQTEIVGKMPKLKLPPDNKFEAGNEEKNLHFSNVPIPAEQPNFVLKLETEDNFLGRVKEQKNVHNQANGAYNIPESSLEQSKLARNKIHPLPDSLGLSNGTFIQQPGTSVEKVKQANGRTTLKIARVPKDSLQQSNLPGHQSLIPIESINTQQLKTPANAKQTQMIKQSAESKQLIQKVPTDKNPSKQLVDSRDHRRSTTPKKDNKKRNILAWTPLTTNKPLWGITKSSFQYCEYKNCEITGDRSGLSQADVVIFRLRNLKKHSSGLLYRPYVPLLDYSDMPRARKQDQIWVDINEESPVYTHSDEELLPFDGVFNISINYLHDSDYTLSYIPRLQKRATPIPAVDYSRGKTKMALWFVSHCNASSGRDEYVKELQKYNISVDIIGRCTHNTDGCRHHDTACVAKFRHKYKFYLAFENSICKEYITEKFWNSLMSDSYNIPIALGASTEEYKKYAPPNSYIHTRGFGSAKELAEHMHKIDSDNQIFNSYHKWRETYQLVYKRNSEKLACYLCRQANKKSGSNSNHRQYSKYWSRKNNCQLEPEPLTNSKNS